MPGSEKIIIVQGEVETNSGNIQPKLTVADPPGFNQKVLVLNLHIENSDGFGTQGHLEKLPGPCCCGMNGG